MYGKPKLNRVGAVKDVILGVVPFGDDIDANWVPSECEYGNDGFDLEIAVPKV